MGTALILGLGLLLQVGHARAEDAPATDPTGEAEAVEGEEEAGPTEEIVVLGRREIARRRAEIDRDLKRLDYTARDREGVTVYRPADPWHPSVWVYDDGYVIIKRSPVRFEPPLPGDSRLRYLACLPPFTPLCIRLAGQLVSERKLTPRKAAVITAIQPEIKAWQGALAGAAMAERLGQEIPAQLVATWEHGEPLEPGGAPLPSAEARRVAILAFWATRADTEEGDAARAVIADFVRYVIQDSETPATPAEIAAAEARCACGPLLPELPLGPPPAPLAPAAGP